MEIDFRTLLADFNGNGPATREIVSAAEKDCGVDFPDDYRLFLQAMDGGEGFVGQQYLIAWRANELAPFNRSYEVNKYAPGILLFGSSGGGEGFGFDFRLDVESVVQVPFVGIDLRYAKIVASNFSELLERMMNSNGTLL